METLAHKLSGEDFVVLAVSQDVDGAITVKPYLQEGGYTFPVLLDVQGEVGRKYGVTGYPETFIIDRQGQVVYHHIGYHDWAQPHIEATLRRLIQQGGVAGRYGDAGTRRAYALTGRRIARSLFSCRVRKTRPERRPAHIGACEVCYSA